MSIAISSSNSKVSLQKLESQLEAKEKSGTLPPKEMKSLEALQGLLGNNKPTIDKPISDQA